MRNLNYNDLLRLEAQVIHSQNLNLPIYNNCAYEKLLATQRVAMEQLWTDDAEMVHDFDFVLRDPLVDHWLFEEVGLNLPALELTQLQKVEFYERQPNLFIKAVLILVRDANRTLSTANFETLKASLTQNNAKIS